MISLGKTITEGDENILKNIAANIGNHNKSNKDLNKKRKGKYPDLPDLAAPVDRKIKIGEENLLVHRTLASIDISYNSGVTVEAFQGMLQVINGKVNDLTEAGITSAFDTTKITILGMSEAVAAKSASEYEAGDQFNGKFVSKIETGTTPSAGDAGEEGGGAEQQQGE